MLPEEVPFSYLLCVELHLMRQLVRNCELQKGQLSTERAQRVRRRPNAQQQAVYQHQLIPIS